MGDVVVAAGCIAYSGPFTPAFRQQLQLEWIALLKTASVPHTPGTNLIDTLQVLYLAVSFAGACTNVCYKASACGAVAICSWHVPPYTQPWKHTPNVRTLS